MNVRERERESWPLFLFCSSHEIEKGNRKLGREEQEGELLLVPREKKKKKRVSKGNN